MKVDTFSTIEKMTPPAFTWTSSTPPILECSTVEPEMPIVPKTAQDIFRGCIEIGHGSPESSAVRQSSLEASPMADHAARSRLASPEVPESVSSRDRPSSAIQEIVVDNLADELYADELEDSSALGIHTTALFAPAQRSAGTTVWASSAGSCDDHEASVELPEIYDEAMVELAITLQTSPRMNPLPEPLTQPPTPLTLPPK